jgi:hypothetical protein
VTANLRRTHAVESLVSTVVKQQSAQILDPARIDACRPA